MLFLDEEWANNQIIIPQNITKIPKKQKKARRFGPRSACEGGQFTRQPNTAAFLLCHFFKPALTGKMRKANQFSAKPKDRLSIACGSREQYACRRIIIYLKLNSETPWITRLSISITTVSPLFSQAANSILSMLSRTVGQVSPSANCFELAAP
jgi:hypothetical protein